MMREELEEIILTLRRHAWDEEVQWPQIAQWLDNFCGEVTDVQTEQLYALYAVSRFMYFGRRLVREMLRSLYREHFEAPLKQKLRKQNGNTKDYSLINQLYKEELRATRFLGVGNPAESGAHLLYFFRQVNRLPKDLFADFFSAFEPQSRDGNTVGFVPRDNFVRRYVFFDDLVGSGTQVSDYLSSYLPSIRRESPDAELNYMCLFGSQAGMERVSSPELFQGNAVCLFYLDETYKAFESKSRYFSSAPEWFDPKLMRKIAENYGAKLSTWPLGYKDGQLLLAFSHNTPDNAPPIFWNEGNFSPWSPLFMRYDKIYKSI